MKSKPFSIKWKVTEEHSSWLLREYLRKAKKISKVALTDIKFHGGSIFVNNRSVNVREKIYTDDIVEVVFPPEQLNETIKPIDMELEILFEDDHFLVLNKPPYLPTIPSFTATSSLAQGVLHYYLDKGIAGTFHAVNRLDRNTSGIVIVAKHRYAHHLLSLQQKDNTLNRTYLALCHGKITPSEGTLDVPIGRKPDSIIERCVRNDGQKAVTHFRVEKYGDCISLVRLKLETGRTHQIRVHMSYIGHPLLGDDLYGGSKSLIDRQALHSYKTEFYHPFEERVVTIEAPVPEDMMKVVL